LDETFDLNDRKNLPAMRVAPPPETGLPPGSAPSAIKNPRLRAQYEAAIAENNRKNERVAKQVPLRLYGPQFRDRVKRWLVEAYSQPPSRKTEISRYLQIYVRDKRMRDEILSQIDHNLR
jgi:hypothetical protein